ncbi:putative ribonuclease H-like domain-containing protein [Tanacetum coccineum]
MSSKLLALHHVFLLVFSSAVSYKNLCNLKFPCSCVEYPPPAYGILEMSLSLDLSKVILELSFKSLLLIGQHVTFASPTLEATHVEFFSDEDEPEVNLGNITNSYTVPTTPNTRIHKDHPIENVIGDSAFLYGTIEEEVYVTQPPGFKDPDHPKNVYKVVKALYGLHQAPRAWYETLANYLLGNGFKRGKIDQTLFIKKQKGDILLVQVYVDDIIFGSTNKELCTGFEKLIKDKFQMSSMGELTFFLGLQSASTPVDLEKPLVKDGEADDVDVHLYRFMIGSLMYLTASRPDIMFPVCACARFQVTPKTSHLLAVKRISRYLKGTPTLGLWYSRESPFELVAYTDSAYTGATQDRKSTTGGYLLTKGFDAGRFQYLVTCIWEKLSTARQKIVLLRDANKEAKHVKRGRDTKIPQSSGPLVKVGDEVVHKELGDRMERAATTASSLEAEQESGNINRNQSMATLNGSSP